MSTWNPINGGVHAMRRRAAARWTAVCVGAVLTGCGAFNPAFLSTFVPGGGAQFATLDNAPGHVVIVFVNNAEVDERLLAFLESPEGGNLSLTEAEKRELRPRIRLRVQVTFTDDDDNDGQLDTLELELIDGSSKLVDQNFDAQATPDLNQNDLNNVVVVCDVAGVRVDVASIEVFVPVELIAFQLVETTTGGGGLTTDFQPRTRTPPRFIPLSGDVVDDDNTVLIQGNIGLRDAPSPVVSPLCGSVIGITLNGVLSVPFLPAGDGVPSFDQDDATTIAQIGGRFEFRVSVQ